MREYFGRIGVAVGLILASAGLAASPATVERPVCEQILPADLLRICERGELRVARYNGERPPFFQSSGEVWEGFDVDLGRDIAQRLGVGYAEDLSATSFDGVVDLVTSGAADLGLSKLSSTLERARRVRFTNPYLTVYQAVLVNRLSAPAGGDLFESLNSDGFVIGALAGSSYVGYARSQFARADVRALEDFEAMMRDVVDGQIDAALMDSARANTWRHANIGQLIQVRTTIDRQRKDPLAMAVAWEDTHFLAWLNLYLQRIKADGTADRLYQRWFVESRSARRRAGGR